MFLLGDEFHYILEISAHNFIVTEDTSKVCSSNLGIIFEKDNFI